MTLHPDRRSILTGLAALPILARTSLAKTGTERPFDLRVIMSGHSLTDPIPIPLTAMVQAAGGAAAEGMRIDADTVPGSPIEIRWNERGRTPDAREDLANYDVLVLTERVPVRSAMQWHRTKELSLDWFNLAWTSGNGGRGAETVLYASWISTTSGPGNQDAYDSEEKTIPFRERLELEMGSWQEIADHVNRSRVEGSPPMRAIPGPLVMAAVYDAIAAGTAPGLTAMTDLFEDSIHVNYLGGFLIALAHFAVIYGRDPRSIPDLRGEGNWPSRDQADWMKQLVWDVVRAYPDSGLT
ncbi:hypothetical protein [Tabrizicola sp.]|jgi:hypothetical protein|uniref:hypothetical protein n=1 Tax=Tabrizicola sp. TaxID=2005166 RepID=UPI0035B2D636